MTKIYSKYLGESVEKKTLKGHIKEFVEISSKEVEEYEKELEEIADKLEKSGVYVKNVNGVKVDEYEQGDDFYTEEAWGGIELSKPIKDEKELEKILKIVKPYNDILALERYDFATVGDSVIYVIFKIVDIFEQDEDEYFEESSKRKMFRKSKKLSEKNKKTLKKALKEGEDKYWKAYDEAKKIIEDANVPEVHIEGVTEDISFFVIHLVGKEGGEKELVNASKKIKKNFTDNAEKYPLIDRVFPFFGERYLDLTFYINEEAYLKDIEESRIMKKIGKRMNEKSEIKSYERTIKKIEKDLEDNGFEVVDSGVEKEKGFETGGKDFAEYWGYVNLKYKIADEDECRKIKDIISGYTFDNSEDDVNCFEGEKTIDIKMGHGSVDEACSKRRKRLSEKDSKTFNKALNDFKNLVRDIAKEIGIDMYIDDIWTNSENEGKVIVDFDKKVPSQKAEALRKSLEDDIRVEKITKKDNGFVVIFKEKYRNLEESIKRKRLKESNSKKISFKQFKKLKESKMRKSLFSKRKLNESDSVSIEIDFGNYYECLRCIFKDVNENLPRDQIYWYTELGMEFGIDPNSMYEWIKNEAELLSVDEIKEYKDLGDVSDEEAIDFAQEKGYYMGEVNGDVYFLVPLGE